MRPQIVLMSLQKCNIDLIDKVNAAIAIEFFHQSSLILDDLPCMDNAEMRRGQRCVHKQYGEAHAILVAMSLINKAYHLLWSAIRVCTDDNQDRCAQLVEECLGVLGLTSGQSLDLEYNLELDDELYIEKIYELKTSSLFKLSMVLPLYLMNKEEHVITNCQILSIHLGKMYQLIDDFQDYYLENNEHLEKVHYENFFIVGKKSRDKELRRPNLVYKLGESMSYNYLKEYMDKAMKLANHIATIDSDLAFYQILVSTMNEKFKIIKSKVSVSE